MLEIAEHAILLRTHAELPVGLKLTTHEFRAGWNFVRMGNAHGLEKKIKTHGWNFIRIADRLLKSGVGATAQEAIAGALRLAVQDVSEYFNTIEVGHIKLTQYPWFFLASACFCPYRIGQGALQPVPDKGLPRPILPRQSRLPSYVSDVYPDFGSAMPLLRQMLLSSESLGNEPQ